MYEAHLNPLEPAAEHEPEYAGWLRRVAASLLDMAVWLGILFAGFFLFGAVSETAFVGFVVLWFVAIFVYDPLCHAVSGQTLGKRWMGITVVRPSGERVGFGRALWRHLAKFGLGIVPLLGLLDHLNPLASKKNQTVHDALASTVVVVRTA